VNGLAARINDALPQTQCTRCGYPDCAGYAQAVADEEAGINQCPPGGAEGIERLALITGRPLLPLDAQFGTEGPSSTRPGASAARCAWTPAPPTPSSASTSACTP
jgi:electron transport complex protein RnfB